MDIGKSFSYQFDDRQWITKLGIGALISLVPVLNLALTGYMVAIIRNVAASAAEPLPNWDDLWPKLRDGLILTAAGLVYAAPVFILMCLPLAFFAASGSLPQDGSWQALGHSLSTLAQLLLAGLFCLFMLYLLFLSLIHPVILVIYSRDGTFASCFRLGEILRILGRHAGLFSTTWIVTILAGFALGIIVALVNLVVGWVPCLGWILGLVLGLGSGLYLITGDAHLFGQFRVAALGFVQTTPATHV